MGESVGDSIPGWFNFREWYDKVAAEAPAGSTLVELGVFCGRSLAHIAKLRGKDCRVVGVDTFLGSPEFGEAVLTDDGRSWADMETGVLAGFAVNHLAAAGVIGDVTLIVSDSAKAAEFFPDGSVWSVFVDAGHDAASVERDCRAWWPKVAPGGVIAGDDFDSRFPGVREGVMRAFPDITLPPEPNAGTATVWCVRKAVAA